MGNFTKKLSSVVLSATTALWLTGTGVLMPVAHGATTAELQAQIQALLTQITALQAQLGNSSSASVSCTFSRNLTVGVSGDDVKCLQKYLNGAGYKIADSGAGSPGNESMYFGNLTKAAAAKWQAAKGVSPAVGFFGSISRAKYSELAATTPTAPTTPTTPTVTGSGLTVSLASDQPAPGLFGESFASRPFTKLQFTASADGDVTVKSVTVERTGQGQDAVFNGVVLLDADGVRVGDAKTFGSDHKLKLADSFVVKAGQTRALTLAGDSDTDQNDYNGQLVSLALVGVDAGTSAVNASFPITGTTHTVNSTLAVGTLTLTRGALDPGTGLTKEIGTVGYTFAGLKLTAGSNEDVSVKSIRWNQSSSAAAADLANIKTVIGGVDYPATVSADGKYYTSSLGDGLKILKGNNLEVALKGDVVSGSNRGVDFDLYRYADIKVAGLTYGYDILPTATEVASESATDDDGTFQAPNPKYDAYEVTIGSGSITAEKATGVGAQNVASNLSGQVLGGIVVDVKGEDVSVAAMNFDVSTVEAAGTGGSIDSNDLTSISLYDEAGKVVAGPVDGVAGANNAIRFTDSITFPVGRHTYTLKAKYGTDFLQNDQVSASTTPSTDWSTVKGVVSNQTITPSPTSAVTLSVMTVKTADLRVTLSTDTASSSPNQNVVAGTSAYPFAKYVLDASNSGEDIRITSMQLDLTTSYPANTADELTNCQLFDGAAALNSGTNVLNPANTDAAGADKTFTFDQTLIVPKGISKTLTLKCNFIAGGTAEFEGWGLASANATVSATGAVSGTSLNTDAGGGLTITANNGRTIVGQSVGTLAVALDSSSPALKLVQGGATDQILSVFRLNASYEDIRLEQLGLQIATSTSDNANASNSPSDLTKVTLWDGATKVSEVIFTGDYATATLTNFVIPKDGQKLLTVKADLAPVDVTMSQAIPGHLINVDQDGAWGDAPDDGTTAGSYEGRQGFKAVGLSSGNNLGSEIDFTDTASNGARIVKSVPTFTKLATSGKFSNTSDQILYRFKVDSPAGGHGVGLYKFTFNVTTSTTAVIEYGGTGVDPDNTFAVTNLRVFCYSDAAFSNGSCGNTAGQLNQAGLLVADNAAGNIDFEDTVTTADPDVDVAVYFNPTTTSGATKEAIRIPAGESRWFELRGNVTGASSTPSITTKMLGDAAWQASSCTNAANELTVSICDYSDPADTESSPASAFAGTASLVDGDGETAAAGEADNNFIWSDNATNTSQAIGSFDWFNGFLVPGLPTVQTASEVVTF